MRRSLLSVAVLATLMLFGTLASASAIQPLVANSDQACLIRVTAPDAVEGDALGGYVAISHETMVVTADSSLGGTNKAAYIYVRSAAGWTLQQELPFDAQPECVAIDGDTLAVGLRSTEGSEEHELQIWVRESGVWRLQSQFPFGADLLGSLAIDGDTLAAGAPLYGGPPDVEVPGSVRIYLRSGDTWALQQTLVGDTGSAYDYFGNAVALEGDRLVVGAPGESAPARNAGAVYVFARTDSAWSKQARLVVPDAVKFDSLGTTVALDGDQLAAGAGGWHSQTGAIYVWQYDGSAWASRQLVTAPDGRPGNLVDYGGDSFGVTFAIAGDTLVVGAPEDDDKGSNSGSVYVLRRVQDTWVHQRKVVAPDGAKGDYFGLALAVDSGRVVVGVRGDDSPLHDAGSVYAFDLGYSTPVGTTLTVQAPGILVNDSLPDQGAVITSVRASAHARVALSSGAGFAAAEPSDEAVLLVVAPATSPVRGDLVMAPDSTFTYTPQAGWKGADKFEYAFSLGAASSNAATVTVETWQPTTVTLSASDATPRYSGSTTLKAAVRTVEGVPLAGRSVIFEVLSGTTWVSLGTATSPANGLVSRSVTGLTSARTYRARIAYSSTYGAAGSAQLRVAPRVSLSTPAVPAAVSRGRSFSVSGTIKPRHSAGSRPVRLEFYKYEGGAWVLKKTVSAKVKNYSTYSKYTVSVSLALSGRWRVRAYHASDSSNALSTSAYHEFKVR